MDSQAFSYSDPIGSARMPILNWDATRTNKNVASRVENQISNNREALDRTQTKSYKDYVDICNKAGSVILRFEKLSRLVFGI